MGLFDWFSKPRRFKQLNDLIWMNRAGRLAGIVQEVQQRSDEGEPLMRLFFADWAREVLPRLGMQEDESIESGMVSRRLRKAQQLVAQNALRDEPADSAQQWFERNTRGGASGEMK